MHRTGWLILALAVAWSACSPDLMPSSQDDAMAWKPYRDTLLDVGLVYPEGWFPSGRTSVGAYGTVHDLWFEPLRAESTRRITVKVLVPDRPREGRTLGDFKAEVLERLIGRGAAIRLDDTGSIMLGGEPAFRIRYTALAGGTPFLRHADILCLRDARDVSLSLESAEAAVKPGFPDFVLFEGMADRFRFL
jgi:hypothetical protein